MKIAIIGINGYGVTHLQQALELQQEGKVKLEAVSDLKIESEVEAELSSLGTRMYSDYKEMLAVERSVDLVIVSTPIHLHATMGVDVMEAGFDLLLEKPPAALIQDVDRLIEANERTGKLCIVNFSFVSLSAFQKMNDWIVSGKIGKVKAVKGLGLWQRTEKYYNRTPWAGKLKVNGHYVLDGTIMNPFSHQLNLLMRMASLPALGGVPVEVQAELYRANDIEGEDISSIRVKMSSGVPVYFTATTCATAPYIQQRAVIEGTEGSIAFGFNGGPIILKSGEEEVRFEDTIPIQGGNLLNYLQLKRGEVEEVNSSLSSTRMFLQVANGAFESAGGTVPVPAEFVSKVKNGADLDCTCVPGLEEKLLEAYEHRKLLSELEIPWAKASQAFDLAGYQKFSGINI